MDEVKVIEIKKSIFDENNKDADNLRSDLKNLFIERYVFPWFR